MTRHLFSFGFGYTAQALARRLAAEGWIVGGTCRTAEKAAALRGAGFRAELFDRTLPLASQALEGVTHLLVSVPPDATGDPVLAVHRDDIAQIEGLRWLGYLSTTGVYGDRGGAWVDETAELLPSGERGRRRVAAEAGWLDLWRRRGVPVHIFRLAGIYGPGRSGSTNRARCSPAFMSRIWRLCLLPRLAAPDPGPSTTSATTIPRRPRLLSRMPRHCSVCQRRRSCRSRPQVSRREDAASTTTTSGYRTA